MTRYPFYRQMGGPQDRSGLVRGGSSSLGLNPGPSNSYRLRYPGRHSVTITFKSRQNIVAHKQNSHVNQLTGHHAWQPIPFRVGRCWGL